MVLHCQTDITMQACAKKLDNNTEKYGEDGQENKF